MLDLLGAQKKNIINICIDSDTEKSQHVLDKISEYRASGLFIFSSRFYLVVN